MESLAEAGAFDTLSLDRAAVFAGAELILAHAASAHDHKTTGQAALFGGVGADVAPIRLPRNAQWTLAQRMAAERDAFGYYFSAHPVEAHKHLLAAHKVRTYAEIGEMRVGEGELVSASMAALVEDVRWRPSARGRRYMIASLSDSSGQYSATAFDEEATAALEAAARDGGSGLLSVELDRRAGDEMPRVTVRRFQPLASLAKNSRLQMIIRLADEAAIGQVAEELAGAKGGNGLVRLTVRLANGGEASLVAGRDFSLDAELSARIERIAGEGSVELTAQEPARLALVG
jgi:DNA polymerase-3 subunit alpha